MFNNDIEDLIFNIKYEYPSFGYFSYYKEIYEEVKKELEQKGIKNTLNIWNNLCAKKVNK